MARMVFGEWRGDGRGTSQSALHFPVQSTDKGYESACGRIVSIARVSTGMGGASEAERQERGERATSCKSCRRQMGWPVSINGKIINDNRAKPTPVGRPLIDVLTDD